MSYSKYVSVTPKHTPKSGMLSVYFDYDTWYASILIGTTWKWHTVPRTVVLEYIERGYYVEIKGL